MMNTHTATERFRKSVFIFTIGLLCGVLIFHRYLKQYGCLVDLTPAGIPMTPRIFAGIIRSEHDMNETRGLLKMMKMLQNNKVHVTALVCQEHGDVERFSGLSGCIRHLYQHQNKYEWFVLTPDVVNVDVLPSLLMSLPHHVPISLVYPQCPSLFDLPDQPHIVILNHAALTRLLRHRMGISNTAMCGALVQETVNLPFEEVAATSMYGSSRGDSKNIFDETRHTLPKANIYTVAIRHLEARLRLQLQTVFLKQAMSFIDVSQSPDQLLSAISPRHIREGRETLKEWDFINASHIHSRSNSHAQPTESVYNRGRELILSKSLNVGMNVFSGTQPACTYQRVVVGRAVEHIMIHNQKERNYKAIQRFNSPRFQEIKSQRDRNLVIVLPLLKRSADFIRFIKRLRSVALDFKGSLMLNVVLFRDKKGEHIRSSDAVLSSTGSLEVKVIPGRGKFTRAVAIVQGVAEVEEDTRVLIMDVDIMCTVGFLNRVVMNTRQGKPFFPIYFSRYDPRSIQTRDGESARRFVFDERFGRWRYFSYGVVGIYKSDISYAGNFDKSLQGWGMEDVEFYEQCLMSQLKVFRSVDLGLWHIYHARHCDPRLRQERLEMCYRSRLELERSQTALAAIVLNLTRSDLIR